MDFFNYLAKWETIWTTIFKVYNPCIEENAINQQGLPQVQTRDSLGSWIEAELRFLRDVVQPALGASRSATQDQKQVGKDKLAYLWQNRKAKAIQVILNDSKYPSAPACTNSKQLVQKYYTSKCVPERPESTLSVPPWTGSLNPVQYSHLNASLFTVSEVEKVIINLPIIKQADLMV